MKSLDEPVMMIDVDAEAVYYYHQDANGNVICMTNDDREIEEGYSYDAFGLCIVNTSAGNDNCWLTPDGDTDIVSAIGNPYLFTARRLDTETGLYYYRFRMYDPFIGRFCQPDPISYAGGMNLYAYVGNNPLNWIDPWGLDAKNRMPWGPGGNPYADKLVRSRVNEFKDIEAKLKPPVNVIPGSPEYHDNHPHHPWQDHTRWLEKHRNRVVRRQGPPEYWDQYFNKPEPTPWYRILIRLPVMIIVIPQAVLEMELGLTPYNYQLEPEVPLAHNKNINYESRIPLERKTA